MNQALPAELLDALCRLAAILPQGLSGQLAAAIREARSFADREALVRRVLSQLHPDNRSLFSEFANAWLRGPREMSAAEVAAAFDAATFQERRLREQSSVELVWTGPRNSTAGLRNTEQVLLEMIGSARETIWLVTFAAYKVESLAVALGDAEKRGVRISLIIEDREQSAGKLTVDGLPALSAHGHGTARIYVWPLEQRARNERGYHGSLHAKCVLVDSQRLFVSSANMTEFALTLNIELGVLLCGGFAPRQVEKNLAELIRNGILQEQ